MAVYHLAVRDTSGLDCQQINDVMSHGAIILNVNPLKIAAIILTAYYNRIMRRIHAILK